jgi:hypothetical protein
MDFVKKNIVSIICGVIAIAAVVAAFVPLGGMVVDVQGQLDKSAQTHKSMQELGNKARQLPIVDPDKAEAETLTAFPSQKVIDQGKAIVEEMKKQSSAMLAAAIKMNEHKLLVDKSLPTPPSQFQQYQFRDQYRDLLLPVTMGALPKIATTMKGGVPPTSQDLEKRKLEIAERITKELLITVAGQATNQQQVQQAINDAVAKLPQEMRQEMANKSLVYVNPDAFDFYQPISGPAAPDPVNIFAAQLALWVQQDVAAAINDANRGAKNVTDAAVKRLIKIQVPAQFVRAAEVPTSGDPDGAVNKAPAWSPTGRVSNPLYDVVHFTMQLDVEQARLNQFLRTINTNRLINVINVNYNAIDAAERLGQGFIYGDKPVINVQVDCEALFMRSWMTPLMPPIVKQSLGITDQPAGTPPAEGQPQQAADQQQPA